MKQDFETNQEILQKGFYKKQIPPGENSLLKCLAEIIYFSSYNTLKIQNELKNYNLKTENWKSVLDSVHQNYKMNIKVFELEKGQLNLIKENFDVEFEKNMKIFLLISQKKTHFDVLYEQQFIKHNIFAQNIIFNILDEIIKSEKQVKTEIDNKVYRNFYYENYVLDSIKKIVQGEGNKTIKKSLSDQFNQDQEMLLDLEKELFEKYDKIFTQKREQFHLENNQKRESQLEISIQKEMENKFSNNLSKNHIQPNLLNQQMEDQIIGKQFQLTDNKVQIQETEQFDLQKLMENEIKEQKNKRKLSPENFLLNRDKQKINLQQKEEIKKQLQINDVDKQQKSVQKIEEELKFNQVNNSQQNDDFFDLGKLIQQEIALQKKNSSRAKSPPLDFFLKNGISKK